MSSPDGPRAETRTVPAPGYLFPALRCALEMVLVASIVGMIGLPASSDLHLGIVLIAMVASMVVVLFWALNRHIAEWIRRAQGRPKLT